MSSTAMEGYERYHQFMDKLAECNVDEYIDLPMIAVMGDTSSGKSSLLSNISLVELPSADSLTTRCPIMLKMHYAPGRSACVKVSWKDKPNVAGVDFEERRIKEENWGSITSAIADAQSHIIQKSGKGVARDIVSVDMSGPHCENLTLIDLPGIVRTTGKGESTTLSKDIQGLMNDYLSNPRCVILAVHPCNVNYHNSQILAEAEKVDPEGKRTIPVLTKPDLIDEGGEMDVKDLLLGAKTDSYFHMVKGRRQAALNNGESIEEGLKDEESFFKNTEPWRGVKDENLFGTKNLRVKLSSLQMQMIRSSFRDIVTDLKKQHVETLMNYQALGDIPSSPTEKKALFRSIREEVWNGIGTKTLDGRIFSLHNDKKMRPSAKFHEASKSYKDTLVSSKLANISDIRIGSGVIVVDNKEEYRGEVCYIDKAAGHVFLKECVTSTDVTNLSIVGRKKNKPGNIINDGEDVYIERDDGTIDLLVPYELKKARQDPEWISVLIKQNRPYKLPIFINTYVFEAIVADLIEKEWAEPTIKLLVYTSELMESAAEEFIKETKQIAPFPLFQTYLITKACEVVEYLARDTKRKIEQFIEREKVPYTQNHYLFENVCKLRSQRLMNEVLAALPQGSDFNKGTKSVNTYSLASTVKNVFQRNQERSVDDHMAEEMQNALNGYGKVALKRFIDNVPMMCIEIMQKFADKMNDVLSETTDEEIERLVQAPSSIVSKRKTLKRKAETLEKGMAAVRELF